MKVEPKTLKGFRDFLPKEARKRNYVLNILKEVFESYGFEPLETPALEYEDILSGKYGDEGDKLMYRFVDNGGRKVAMRYDQTVPLARVVAQYQNDLPLPFKRYQIQNVWRAENTQKGRYREFLQVDVDTVGSNSPLADLEVLSCANDSLKKLGFEDFTILVNDRRIFVEKNISPEVIRILDKEDKIGIDKMLEEMSELLGSNDKARESYEQIKNLTANDFPESFQRILERGKKLNIFLLPSSRLARGLDYYTSLIFEIKIDSYKGGSIGGGGRYDNLIGMFGNQQIPAVGFSFGFDRIIEAMEELNLFEGKDLSGTKVLVTNTSDQSAKVADDLRSKNINVELYVDDKPLDKQLKYADKKQILYVLIVEGDNLTLKNMKTGEKQTGTLDQLSNALLK